MVCSDVIGTISNGMQKLKLKARDILRRSEKYTKTDMVYLAKGGSWFGLGTALSWVISFGTALAFANLIPKETFGAYQYVLSIIGIFGIMTLTGMNTAISRAAARGKDGSLFEALKEKIKWGLLGGLGAIFLGAYYLLKENPMLGWAFIIAGILIPFWETPGIYISYAQGKKRFDISSVYDVGAQLLAAIAVIIALYVSKNLIVILTSYLLGWGLSRTLLFYITVRKLPPNKERDPDTISYGKHLTVMSAVSKISVNIDTVLLWHLVGPASVAAYIFAQALPLRVAGLAKMADRLAFPKMAIQDMATIQKTLLHKVLLMCAAAALAAIAYIIAAPYLFKLFFPKYIDVVPLTQLLSLLIVLQPLGLFLNPLTSHAKKKLLYVYNLGLPMFRIAIFLLLIPYFGLMGAVIALILVKAFDGGFLAVLFYRA